MYCLQTDTPSNCSSIIIRFPMTALYLRLIRQDIPTSKTPHKTNKTYIEIAAPCGEKYSKTD